MNDIPLTAPAADRNKEAILGVLAKVLPADGLVLEIASGTGQHAVHFAQALPSLVWQPSDSDRTMRESIRGWIAESKLRNLRAPLDIDVRAPDWRIDHADAILCINMVHIAPLSATTGLLEGAARRLAPRGNLVLYGPFRQSDRPTAASNETFDALLRSQNLDWGLRDLNAVTAEAAAQGLALRGVIEMPASNLVVLFEKSIAAARPGPVAPNALARPLEARPTPANAAPARDLLPDAQVRTPASPSASPLASPDGPAPADEDALMRWLARPPDPTVLRPSSKALVVAIDAKPAALGFSLMITRAQRLRLVAMGHSEDAIRAMTPAVAHALLAISREPE